MTFPPDGPARSSCLAADEALTAAAFCTGDFAEADRLFTQAQVLAARAGDGAGEAFATGGLAMVLHHRNLGKLIDGSAPTGTDVEAEEELMRRALVIWQETGDAAGTARGLFGRSAADPQRPGRAGRGGAGRGPRRLGRWAAGVTRR